MQEAIGGDWSVEYDAKNDESDESAGAEPELEPDGLNLAERVQGGEPKTPEQIATVVGPRALRW